MSDNQYVRQTRRQLSLTQGELADLLYVTSRTVLRYENGGNVPIRKLLAIQNLLEKNNVHQPTG
jgi:predicted transcriptional regulator